MKIIGALLFLILTATHSFSQSAPLEGFLDGKSVVLISAAPGAKPVMTWKMLAEEIHGALVAAGGDPVAYYELEDVILSEGTQAGYAETFSQRLIKNIVAVTRKANAELVIHIMPFTQDKRIVLAGSSWSVSSGDMEEFKQRIAAIGTTMKSKNFLVIDVPEFFEGAMTSEASKSNPEFLTRNPLNLDVFKLGVRLAGAAGEGSFLTTFRYDLMGKSQEQILAEQQNERNGLEAVFKAYYPYEVEFLSTPKTDAELIQDRVQFVLMRMEGREGDLMKSMGIEIPENTDTDRIVVKYYIRFLVRNEQYIGPIWDADPDWNTALINFLKHLAPVP
jgi:hypothetical protein